MRVLFIASMLVLALAFGGQAPAGTVDPAADVAKAVRAALAQAPTAFAAARGKQTSHSSDEIRYAIIGALKPACPDCKLTDEFADEDAHERWVASFDYTLPKGWSASRSAEFIATVIGPIVRDYSLQTGTDDDGLTYFDWKRGRTFVYAYSWTEKQQSTLRVRVGQYTTKDAHVAKYSTPLTDAQKTMLDTEIKEFLSVGLANAGENFVTIRGKGWGSDVYDATMNFSMLNGCAIDGWKKSTVSSAKWILDCDTDAFIDDKATLEPALAHTIWYALPSAFRQSSDSDRGTNDYRWDDSTNTLSVMLNSSTYGKRTHYTISIYHFIDP